MRIALCFVLAVASAPAWAEWTKVTQIRETVYYVNTDETGTGNLRTIQMLVDHSKRQLDGQLSEMLTWELDCQKKRMRIVGTMKFSEPMIGGKNLSVNFNQEAWGDVPPQSGEGAVFIRGCSA